MLLSKCSFALELADVTTGLPMSITEAGRHYDLNVYVQDVRATNATGAFTGYLDVTYNSSLAPSVGAVSHFHPTLMVRCRSAEILPI